MQKKKYWKNLYKQKSYEYFYFRRPRFSVIPGFFASCLPSNAELKPCFNHTRVLSANAPTQTLFGKPKISTKSSKTKILWVFEKKNQNFFTIFLIFSWVIGRISCWNECIRAWPLLIWKLTHTCIILTYLPSGFCRPLLQGSNGRPVWVNPLSSEGGRVEWWWMGGRLLVYDHNNVYKYIFTYSNMLNVYLCKFTSERSKNRMNIFVWDLNRTW